ncbi:MAG TPA: hypothetical protein VMF91_24090 [Bryobacteraceae bacterium]|nr:hypothetical protein [Bryobacteraceae bacterium]
MNTKLVEDIANAVLYEGYILYPYRATAVKNRQRWNFGVLYPRAFAECQRGADAWSTQTECLAWAAGEHSTLRIRVRFLHLIERSSSSAPVWQEATERDVAMAPLNIPDLAMHRRLQTFSFAAACETEGDIARVREPLDGAIEVEAERLRDDLFKIRISVFNTALVPADLNRNAALMRSLVSAHTILELQGGEFISLLDPPEDFRDDAAQCKNIGTWPVLAGDAGARDAMLSSPIILYDYPQIAPESAGALFDGTEIDEILTLRIMTLTDEEKLEMNQVDPRARQILERTECMPPEQLMKMHGALRGLRRLHQETP